MKPSDTAMHAATIRAFIERLDGVEPGSDEARVIYREVAAHELGAAFVAELHRQAETQRAEGEAFARETRELIKLRLLK